ncbi:anti-sigma factor [Salinimonas lutimaris]|uniref:anti-sigma factor n=1 Tax=Salinimonas lutimaris TaxID=914153 RepID=UPI0010C0C2A7|nr:anti-sigma factor [Salinimonas lutimaris]
MNYLKTELRDALAASYVLGTLQGPARRRFEKLMMRYESLRQATWYWEQQLNQWAEALPPVTPPASVWAGIDKRLNASTSPTASSAPATPWKWISGIAVAAALILAVLLIQPVSHQPASPEYVAVLAAKNAPPLWLIEAQSRKLIIRPTAELPRMKNSDYELWIVPANGNSPISLGVLSQTTALSVSLTDTFDISGIKALAISKEAIGGSKNGAPTEVLYLSSLTRVTS